MAILSLQIEVEAGSILQQDFAAAGKILIHGCLLQGQKLYGFFVSTLPIQIFEGLGLGLGLNGSYRSFTSNFSKYQTTLPIVNLLVFLHHGGVGGDGLVRRWRFWDDRRRWRFEDDRRWQFGDYDRQPS
ncbi:hypothetical protein M5689_020656 [Euphorbia peplus]|nr:hypothetical protein M5689_020656 [Euphorbia peplus]